MATANVEVGSIVEINVGQFSYFRGLRPPRFIKVVEIAPDGDMLCEYRNDPLGEWRKHKILNLYRVRDYIRTGIASIVGAPKADDETARSSS